MKKLSQKKFKIKKTRDKKKKRKKSVDTTLRQLMTLEQL